MQDRKKTNWSIDPSHTEIGCKVKHLMISNVKGHFNEFGGTVSMVENDFTTAEVNFWIVASSIDTGDLKRDKHLMGADFFDSEYYPRITFGDVAFKHSEDADHYELYGDLTMKGILRRIKLQLEFGGITKDPWGKVRAGFSLKGSIDRSDWDLNWNTILETGGVFLANNVKILCEVELIKMES